ncbi:MAG: hypothetical protein ABIQ62_03120, partial [Thermomonas sp.]
MTLKSLRRCIALVLPTAFLAMAIAGCQPTPAVTQPVDIASTSANRVQHELPAQVDDLEQRTFDYFWELGNPSNGLIPDRWPSPSASSIAAVGFGLTAYGVGAERGWISREQAAQRTLATLRFFARAPQGPQPAGVSG